MLRARTFTHVNELVAFMRANSLSWANIFTLNYNATGHVDIVFDDGDWTYVTGVASGAATGAATISVNATTKKFTRSAGSFITDGFAVGDVVTFSGYANVGNNASFVVTEVAALYLVCADAAGLTTEAGTGDETATVDGHVITVPAGAPIDEMSFLGKLGDGTVTINGGGDIQVPSGGSFAVSFKDKQVGPMTITVSANLYYFASWTE